MYSLAIAVAVTTAGVLGALIADSADIAGSKFIEAQQFFATNALAFAVGGAWSDVAHLITAHAAYALGGRGEVFAEIFAEIHRAEMPVKLDLLVLRSPHTAVASYGRWRA